MMRRWFVLILVLFGVLPVFAQATPWTAWLYNTNGTMTRISSAGEILAEFMLPTVQGHEYPQWVAVAPSGNYVTYATTNRLLNVHRIVFYDLALGVIMGDAVLPDLTAHSLQVNASPSIYTQDDILVAVGLAPFDGIWRVVLYQTFSGGIHAELRADNPAVTALGLPADVGVLPQVEYVQGNEVVFTLQRADGGASYGVWRWNYETNALTPHDTLPSGQWDLFAPTGEMVAATHNPALPSSNPEQRNALEAHLPAGGRIFPFYASPDRALNQPHFIQNGERILVETTSGTDSIWRVVERNGALVGEIQMQTVNLFGLADGFIYLTQTNPVLLMVANTRTGIDAGLPIGQAAPDARIQLAWAGNSVPPAASAYQPWLDLLDTVSIAQATQIVALSATPTPTAIPTVPTETPLPTEPGFYVAPTPVMLPTPSSFRSQLSVGDRAVVTSAGHGAGLHTNPDDDAPNYILLYTDMRVDVLEGPEITDGYIWWRVRTTAAGREHTGWAIEGAQGAAWLVPVGRMEGQ